MDKNITVAVGSYLPIDENGKITTVEERGEQAYIMIDSEVIKIVSAKSIIHNGKPAKELVLSRYPFEPGTECKNIIQADG